MMRPNACLASILPLLLAAPAAAQVSFSIDWHGPLRGTDDFIYDQPITEGDSLIPEGTVATIAQPGPPGITFPAGVVPFPGLRIATHATCVGTAPCIACPIEVDASSNGFDRLVAPDEPPGTIYFSVDEYATGWTGSETFASPNVITEGASASGAKEAAADVFVDLGLPTMPVMPYSQGGPVVGHVGTIDGNGDASSSGSLYPGFGVAEPIPPSFATCNAGTNVDAISVGDSGSIFFSLDAAFADPLSGPSQGTAAANGFSGADVLVSPFGGSGPQVYASAMQLGLDAAGPDTDDVDAIILFDAGFDQTFTPSVTPFDWLTDGTDMLLFSVRRGSAILGTPDSIFGVPIEEGDVLTTPPAVGGAPGIVIPAEALGLATIRSGFPNSLTSGADDLDGLYAQDFFPVRDCNTNGIEDAIDVATGSSVDANANGLPDECELVSVAYCTGAGCPCGNDSSDGGCLNENGVGASLLASGTTSLALDDLVLTATNLPPNRFGAFVMSFFQGFTPFANGLRCIGDPMYVFDPQRTGTMGQISLGPGIASLSCSLFTLGCIGPNSAWNFQAWYRDPGGPCGATSNFTDALQLFFMP